MKALHGYQSITAAEPDWVTLLHVGVVIVADGTKEAESRIDHSFLWGIVRHADAGYELEN